MNTRPDLTLTPIAEIKAVVDLLDDLELDPLHLHIDGARPSDTRPDIKLWLRYRTDFVRVCEALRAKPVERRYAPAGQRHWFAEHDTATGRLLVQVVSLPHHHDYEARQEQP